MPSSTGEDWFGTPDASRYLGVRLRTLYRLVDAGELRAYKIGRVIRIRRIDLDSYLERHVIEPGTLGHLYSPGGTADDDDEGAEDPPPRS